MKDLKITKGEFILDWWNSDRVDLRTIENKILAIIETDFINKPQTPFVELEANAELFKDSIETANKCNLLPSELLEQRNELLKACNKLISASKVCKDYIIKYREAFEEIKQAIKKVQQ